MGISRDLSRVRIARSVWPAPPGPERLVDLATGVSTTLAVADDGTLTDRSPDLHLAVRLRTVHASTNLVVEVVDLRTAAVVATVGPLRTESTFYIDSVHFLDATHLLVDAAVPATSTPDGIADDGAFVADLATGATTRVDPGLAGATTLAATIDGSRSLHRVAGVGTVLRVGTAPPVVVAPVVYALTPTDRSLRTVAWATEGEAHLRCI